jgi:hypothetical protein
LPLVQPSLNKYLSFAFVVKRPDVKPRTGPRDDVPTIVKSPAATSVMNVVSVLGSRVDLKRVERLRDRGDNLLHKQYKKNTKPNKNVYSGNGK